MSTQNSLQGVSCNVSDCVHNSKNSLCQARHIQVGNETHNKCDAKTDTFCNTFQANASIVGSD